MNKTNELMALYRESFNDSKEYIDNFFKCFYSKKNVKYLMKNSNIVSALYLIEKRLRFDEKICSIDFVVGASTKKQERGKGYFKKLLKKALSDLLDKKAPLIMLYPQTPEVYKRFGFVTVSNVGSFVAKYDGIDAVCSNATTQEVMQIFNETLAFSAIAQYRNFDDVTKIKNRWSAEGIVAKLYERDGKRCYVATSPTEIEEAVGDLSVLNGVKRFDGVKFLDYFGDDEPFVMARVVDASELLKLLRFDVFKATYSFKYLDEFLPEKTENYQLSICDGETTASIAKDFDFVLTSTDLTKLAFGIPVDGCPLSDVIKKEKIIFIDKY